jgi:predicted Zn finger-like uncharacterized protein
MLIVCPNCQTGYDVSTEALGGVGRTVRCARCHEAWFATPSAIPLPPAELVAASPVRQAIAKIAAEAAAAPEPGAGGDLDGDPAWDVGGSDAAPEAAAPPRADDGAGVWGVPDYESPPLAPTMIDAKAEGPPPVDIETLAARRSGGARRPRRPANAYRTLPVVPALIAIELAAIFAIVAWRTDIVRAMPQTASLFRAIGLPVNLRGLVFSDIALSKDTSDGTTVLIVDGTIENDTRSVVVVPRLRFALRDRALAELVSWTAPPEKSSLAPGETLPFRSRLASPPADGNDVQVRFLNRQDFMNGTR